MGESLTTSDFGADFIKDEIIRRIMDNEAPYIKKQGDTYDVHARNLHFICVYSDDEIRTIANLCLELLEELRSIHESGFTKEDFEKADMESKTQEKDIWSPFTLYNSYKTGRIKEIINRLCIATRVGGAYAMLISEPGFIQGINNVFRFIIGRFEDPDDYFSALFMLIRLAMHMHCDEIHE